MATLARAAGFLYSYQGVALFPFSRERDRGVRGAVLKFEEYRRV